MNSNAIIEMLLGMCLPALVWLLWKLDNRVQALEFRAKSLASDLNRRTQVNAKAIVQLSEFLERNQGFHCRYHSPDGSNCWPSDEPPLPEWLELGE